MEHFNFEEEINRIVDSIRDKTINLFNIYYHNGRPDEALALLNYVITRLSEIANEKHLTITKHPFSPEKVRKAYCEVKTKVEAQTAPLDLTQAFKTLEVEDTLTTQIRAIPGNKHRETDL